MKQWRRYKIVRDEWAETNVRTTQYNTKKLCDDLQSTSDDRSWGQGDRGSLREVRCVDFRLWRLLDTSSVKSSNIER